MDDRREQPVCTRRLAADGISSRETSEGQLALPVRVGQVEAPVSKVYSAEFREHTCRGLNIKCPPQVPVLEHLAPSCWCCSRMLGNLWGVELG